ncbi:MAG: iron-containing alcohol dehydrogenase [Candidatus Accumulibacter phosphatis]|jgi:NADP-dependent alcohol dehydrogenase|uniref:Iron-containing alcohol dehydrogenase n=1 Tax=Candidatus Accumulibacter contiguus TaxID=2954381 RepID=A0ABX1TDI2_9PROT|nr:iron-containing alcohol dehydrogenase [Candidatus Accumulibacter contiguus]NMQ07763.1 iron-containing alcohol dehydrogenase [Candidatus Accumulibacter contiguus]
MQNFTFHNPTRILFGQGRIADIAAEIPAGARVLITYGGGSVVRSGTLDEVKAALKHFAVFEFAGIEPNPTYETLMQAVALARREKVDFLLAVGGGSVIDGTKFIAAAIPFAGDPWDMLAKRAAVTSAIAFGSVLTLPATGSEMNNGAVITRRASNDKLAFLNDRLFPRFSVLDPSKTFTLPPRQVANGVVDAFVHIAEQYLTYPADAKVQDRFAEGLLLTLIEEGPRALREPENYAVRANLMWTATLALNGLIGAGVPQDWATHMLGHELTVLHGLDHAQTLAVVLPAMLQVRREEKRDKLLQYADRVWGLREGDAEARIDQAIVRTRLFFESLQVPTRLSGYGIGVEAIAPLVAQLKRHGMVALGEHRSVDLACAQQVYELAA